MTDNQLELSEDRRHLTIIDGDHRITLQSARPDGFNADDLLQARRYPVNKTMVPGQKNRARLIKVGRREVLLQVNTGPPTWWRPRGEFSKAKGKVMVGWLRGLISVAVKRKR